MLTDYSRKTHHHYHIWPCDKPVDAYMYMRTIGEEGILEVIGCSLLSTSVSVGQLWVLWYVGNKLPTQHTCMYI